MLFRSLNRLSLGPLLSLLCSVSCGRQAGGEVILLVSTDLAVPADVDTLNVTVTSNGGRDLLSQHSYSLAADAAADSELSSLPGTLALVSDDKQRGNVHVHLELLSGGATGEVQVERDAEFAMPTEGVKQLSMPLNFLCLKANLDAPCATGTTCRAGVCAADQVSELAEYVAAPARACFDVGNCFGAIDGSKSMPPDLSGHECSIGGPLALGAKNVNLALIVNSAVAGNHGVCDSKTGKCLIPLDPGPEGWQTIRDGSGTAVGIGLPEGVCTARTRISGVAIIQDAACGAKNASVSQCPAPPTCIPVRPADRICPTAWDGFSCSGIQTPNTSLGRQDYCGEVATDPSTGPLVPGLWCCAEKDPPPAEPDPLLIDDMSSGPFIKIKPPEGADTGTWFAATEDLNAQISPPISPTALFTYRQIDPPVTVTAGLTIRAAACLSSTTGIKGDFALEGFNFLWGGPNVGAIEMDLSPYTGIRFWARAEPRKLGIPTDIRVTLSSTDTYSQGPSRCADETGRKSCNDFGKFLTLKPDWREYTVRWTELAQLQFGLLFPNGFNTNVYTVNFLIPGAGADGLPLPFDFCISQLEFSDD